MNEWMTSRRGAFLKFELWIPWRFRAVGVETVLFWVSPLERPKTVTRPKIQTRLFFIQSPHALIITWFEFLRGLKKCKKFYPYRIFNSSYCTVTDYDTHSRSHSTRHKMWEMKRGLRAKRVRDIHTNSTSTAQWTVISPDRLVRRQKVLDNGEKQYSTVTVATVQYYCYSVICLARGSLHHPISSPTA